MNETDALKAQLAAAQEEVARLKALALFQTPELKVHTEARPVDPAQRQRILEVHAKHWAHIQQFRGEERRKETLEFVRMIKSALESRVITPDETQAWVAKALAFMEAP